MSAKHTPGPWRAYIGRKQADGSKPKSSGTVWTKENNILIAGSLHPDDDERDANAAFIVRACNAHDDLVAALKEMVEQYGGMVDSGVEEPARLAVEHAKAALARAEGGKP